MMTTEPTHSSYWAHTQRPLSPHVATTEPTCPRARAPQQENPLQIEARALQLEESPSRPSTAKNYLMNQLFFFFKDQD